MTLNHQVNRSNGLGRSVGNQPKAHGIVTAAIREAGHKERAYLPASAEVACFRAGGDMPVKASSNPFLALIPRDRSDRHGKAQAMGRGSLGRVPEIDAVPAVAVPVRAHGDAIIKASVDAWIDVVQLSTSVSANEVKPDRLCASEHREQQQEKESKHGNLLVDGGIFGAQSHSHKIGQTLVCQETQCQP